jgi:hypothetical protein
MPANARSGLLLYCKRTGTSLVPTVVAAACHDVHVELNREVLPIEPDANFRAVIGRIVKHPICPINELLQLKIKL